VSYYFNYMGILAVEVRPDISRLQLQDPSTRGLRI
jgi:hypothetical protein